MYTSYIFLVLLKKIILTWRMAKIIANMVTIIRHPATAMAVIVVNGDTTCDRTPVGSPSDNPIL